ncbi:MAG: trypsin-like serine protease [Moraxellaceae bacterium]|nr:trypsin-like serine protease [Moraxellaceae bacterium]
MKAYILWLWSLLPVLVYAAPQAKIINGQPVADYQAPWQAALYFNNQQPYTTAYFCSASIVGDNSW